MIPENRKVYILLDVGGTQLKGCTMDAADGTAGAIRSVPAHAQESSDIIFDTLAGMIRMLAAEVPDAEIAAVGMAFPGPFDYENGISRMKGLNKYESICGLSVEEGIRQRVDTGKAPFFYLHDIEAFAVGESRFGRLHDARRMLCLCIGTGAGSAFVENGHCLKKADGAVPENGWLYCTPFREGVIDDYISLRGLERISENLCGEKLDGRALWERCRAGDGRALEVYRQFGEDLFEAMQSFLDGFRPDAVVFGGQISKSFEYFGGRFRKECEARGIRIDTDADTSARAVQGLFISIQERAGDGHADS